MLLKRGGLMDKNILYYPTIEFNAADYEWLWRAALLWDKVYRIVPDGYSLRNWIIEIGKQQHLSFIQMTLKNMSNTPGYIRTR